MARSALVAVAATLCIVVSAPCPARADDVAKQAKEKFDAGRTAYRLGDFDTAITDWKAGYQLKQDPIFLFNIAQAYREKGDFEHAIFFYESYLKDAKDASNRPSVEHRIADMKRALEEKQSASSKPPSGPIEPGKPPETQPDKPPPDKPPVVPAPPEEAHPGRGLKIGGLVAGGVGVVAIVAGVIFGTSAQSAQSDIEDAVRNGAIWTQDLADKASSGKTQAMLANVSFGIGAAAIITGGVLYYLGVRKDSNVQVTPEVETHAVRLSLTVRY
jgi:tetratricopeptide (TPR) repeat protein